MLLGAISQICHETMLKMQLANQLKTLRVALCIEPNKLAAVGTGQSKVCVPGNGFDGTGQTRQLAPGGSVFKKE